MVDEREETGVRGVGWVTGRGAREEASQGGEGQLREAASEGNVLVTKRGHRGCLCVEVSAEGGRMIEEEERDRRMIGEEGRERGGGGEGDRKNSNHTLPNTLQSAIGLPSVIMSI